MIEPRYDSREVHADTRAAGRGRARRQQREKPAGQKLAGLPHDVARQIAESVVAKAIVDRVAAEAQRTADDQVARLKSGQAFAAAPLADLLGGPEAWQERALCAQVDPEAFFPEKGGSTREAKRVCGRCPVRVDCLQHALEHHEAFGIWGGLSERDRRKLKKGDPGTVAAVRAGLVPMGDDEDEDAAEAV